MEGRERAANIRQPRSIVLRYFVMRFLFAGARESRAATLATYIAHNDAVRLMLARAIGKRTLRSYNGSVDKNTLARRRNRERTCTCERGRGGDGEAPAGKKRDFPPVVVHPLLLAATRRYYARRFRAPWRQNACIFAEKRARLKRQPEIAAVKQPGRKRRYGHLRACVASRAREKFFERSSRIIAGKMSEIKEIKRE